MTVQYDFSRVEDFLNYIYSNIHTWTRLEINQSINHVLKYVSISVKPLDRTLLSSTNVLQLSNIKDAFNYENAIKQYLNRLYNKTHKLVQAKVTSIMAADCEPPEWYSNVIIPIKRVVHSIVTYNHKTNDLVWTVNTTKITDTNGLNISYKSMPKISVIEKSNTRVVYDIEWLHHNIRYNSQFEPGSIRITINTKTGDLTRGMIGWAQYDEELLNNVGRQLLLSGNKLRDPQVGRFNGPAIIKYVGDGKNMITDSTCIYAIDGVKMKYHEWLKDPRVKKQKIKLLNL